MNGVKEKGSKPKLLEAILDEEFHSEFLQQNYLIQIVKSKEATSSSSSSCLESTKVILCDFRVVYNMFGMILQGLALFLVYYGIAFDI